MILRDVADKESVFVTESIPEVGQYNFMKLLKGFKADHLSPQIKDGSFPQHQRC